MCRLIPPCQINQVVDLAEPGPLSSVELDVLAKLKSGYVQLWRFQSVQDRCDSRRATELDREPQGATLGQSGSSTSGAPRARTSCARPRRHGNSAFKCLPALPRTRVSRY